MKITLANIGKRFHTEWIFKNVNYEFTDKTAVAIIGANGSGKSTLLQMLAGNITPSKGTVRFENDKGTIPVEDIFRSIAFSAPYLELFPELTLREMVRFHFKFKDPVNELNEEQILDIIDLKEEAHKLVRDFSSGMVQRLKLGLAILSDTPVLLLDEPYTNLDPNGKEWFDDLLKSYARDRLAVICSNHQEGEYKVCAKQLIMEDFRK